MSTVFFHEENDLKLLTALMLILPITVACADSNKSMTQKMFKPLIELQCANELKSSKIWQASAFLWSSTQQNQAQEKICACVSDNALNDIPATELLKATVSESAKDSLVQKAVMNSLKGCAKEALNYR